LDYFFESVFFTYSTINHSWSKDLIMTSRLSIEVNSRNEGNGVVGAVDLEHQMAIHATSAAPSSNTSSNNNNTNNNSVSSHDSRRQPDFSFCILWSPLPIFTWIIPFIGHLGIADSRGYSHDFQGPYAIGTSRKAIMAFGPTTRYLKMDIGQLSNVERWDEAIREADRVYSGRMHSQ
jgi:hypothetical protein